MCYIYKYTIHEIAKLFMICWKYGEHKSLTTLFHLLFANFTIVCNFRFLQISLSWKWMLNNSQQRHLQLQKCNQQEPPVIGGKPFVEFLLLEEKECIFQKLLWCFLTLFSSSHLFLMPFESHCTFCPLLLIQSVTCSSFLVSVHLARLVFLWLSDCDSPALCVNSPNFSWCIFFCLEHTDLL